ncbi:Outer membrane protein TolC [bacterium A37T11]|nr:Outer membrane protein TolC [bacterium A37T11]
MFLTVLPAFSYAQIDTTQHILKIQDLFSLAKAHSKELGISNEAIGISKKQTEIAKAERLPEVEAGLKYGYLSDAFVWDHTLSNRERAAIPHISTDFSIEASQILYKGNAITNNIKKSELAEQLAQLNYDQDTQDILFLLAGKYFDLYRSYNQQKVYRQNIELAKKRLDNIRKLRTEGMVTQNDIVRSELQLTNLQTELEDVGNDITIINRELCTVLGFPLDTKLQVDSTLDSAGQQSAGFGNILAEASATNPAIKASTVKELMADRDIAIAKAARRPVISLYAGDALSRPFLYSLPPMDIYMSFFQAGIKINYNISSLYHAKHHIDLARLEYGRQQKATELVREKTDLAVHQAFVKWEEAKSDYAAYEKSFDLANDNYRIVESKYYNQFAVLTDILDASTAKLNAGLALSNAKANILFRWYQLQKAVGKL